MTRPLIIGVMGGGHCDRETCRTAFLLGQLVAAKGWILLNGGRNCGVMDASAKGASQAGGLTIGILPDADKSNASAHILVAICTGMGSARNAINVLSSDIVVACRGGPGTISEVALALKSGKQVIGLDFELGELFPAYKDSGLLFQVTTAEDAVDLMERLFNRQASGAT